MTYQSRLRAESIEAESASLLAVAESRAPHVGLSVDTSGVTITLTGHHDQLSACRLSLAAAEAEFARALVAIRAAISAARRAS